MSHNPPTMRLTGEDLKRAQELSVKSGRPPLRIPGYDLEQFLGAGAYGEVWVGTDRRTGRRVAVKFYTHRGGLDWSLLSREVEKLRFLFSDRYAVQLLDVGANADPPYYVMEYLERGSLEDRLVAGPLPVHEAVAAFREVAVGLVHAHGKGVLHCDLKPANILLDNDGKPKLADFGQARLSHEQMPTLGTLFYMAPEQADLTAVPDARWDVYALGAVLYRMLTGTPPYCTVEAKQTLEQEGSLEERLARYRKLLRESPRPTEHKKAQGVDAALAEIIERCLAVDPKRRYPNVQAVLGALDNRAVRRGRRPLLVLGAVGPALLLCVMTAFAWNAYRTTLRDSEQELIRRALESERFAAQAVAKSVATQIERRYRAIEQLAENPELIRLLTETVSNAELRGLSTELSEIRLPADDPRFAKLQQRFIEHPARQPLQDWLARFVADPRRPADIPSWVILDAQGTSLARVPEVREPAANGDRPTIGRNYAWRSYFHGQNEDFDEYGPTQPGLRLEETKLSAVFRSQATGRWVASVSTPIENGAGGRLGVAHLTVEVGDFVELDRAATQYAVLIDSREGPNRGLILQHPLFQELLDDPTHPKLPERFQEAIYRVGPAELPNTPERQANYVDPLGADQLGAIYRGRWLAAVEPVKVADKDIELSVIVQENHAEAMQPVRDLGSLLVTKGLQALGVVSGVITLLWGFVVLVLNESPRLKLLGRLRRKVGIPSENAATSTGASDGPSTAAEEAAGEAKG